MVKFNFCQQLSKCIKFKYYMTRGSSTTYALITLIFSGCSETNFLKALVFNFFATVPLMGARYICHSSKLMRLNFE